MLDSLNYQYLDNHEQANFKKPAHNTHSIEDKDRVKEELRESNSALLKILDNTQGIGKPYVPIHKKRNRSKFSNMANTPHYLYQAYKRKIPAHEILIELLSLKPVFWLLHKIFRINQFKNYNQYRVFPYIQGDAQRIYGKNLDNPNHLAHQQEIDDLIKEYNNTKQAPKNNPA